MNKPVETEAKPSAPEKKPFDIFEGLSNEPFKAGNSPSFDGFEGVRAENRLEKKSELPLEKVSPRILVYIVIAIAALVIGVFVGKWF